MSSRAASRDKRSKYGLYGTWWLYNCIDLKSLELRLYGFPKEFMLGTFPAWFDIKWRCFMLEQSWTPSAGAAKFKASHLGVAKLSLPFHGSLGDWITNSIQHNLSVWPQRWTDLDWCYDIYESWEISHDKTLKKTFFSLPKTKPNESIGISQMNPP